MTKIKRVAAGAYLTPGKDDALIDRWTAVPEGQRSEVLKEALEQYFQMPPTQRRNPLSRLADDISRAIKLLEEVRGVVKELSNRPMVIGEKLPTSVADSEASRQAAIRNENMKKNAW